MSTHKTNLDHALQLRLPKATVVDIDNAIATLPILDGFNRSMFIRYSILYALDSLAEVKGHYDLELNPHDDDPDIVHLQLCLPSATALKIISAMESMPHIEDVAVANIISLLKGGQ